MTLRSQPFVSVVTPVYNGDTFLAQCIESVLAQTYDNWEYVIVNNCSTDDSLKIAQDYAKKDSRIRIHDNKEFLPMVQNFNHSLLQISAESKYCKVVHADDWLFPECIERMVDVAKTYPTIGIVGSYVLKGVRVECSGLPYPSTIVSGREICRSRLVGGPYVFGSPTSLLIRSDLIRNRKSFYNELYFHSDVEACFNVLQSSDFGFVHQVLSCTRLHNESQTVTFAERYGSDKIEDLRMLLEYGPIYFNREEYTEVFNDKLRKYYRFLARNVLRPLGKEFWDYHRRGLEKIGYPFNLLRLIKALLSEVIDGSVGRVLRQLNKKTVA